MTDLGLILSEIAISINKISPATFGKWQGLWGIYGVLDVTFYTVFSLNIVPAVSAS